MQNKTKNTKHCKCVYVIASAVVVVVVAVILPLMLVFTVYKANTVMNDINTVDAMNHELKQQNMLLSGQIELHKLMQAKPNTSEFQQLLLKQIFYPYKSDIIYTLDELAMLRKWIGESAWTLIYKSSLSDDSAVKFYKKLMKQGGFLVLVKSKSGARFGGYTSVNFEPQRYVGFMAEVAKQDTDAFVFSLDRKEKYVIKQDKEDEAIYADEGVFLAFGVNDLVIVDGFKSSKSYSMFPNYYEGDAVKDKLALTNGEEVFDVEEVEVYHIFNIR